MGVVIVSDASGNEERLEAGENGVASGRNEFRGTVHGPSVQARNIHGDVKFNFDPSAALPVPNQLLPVPANFTGRESELTRLHRLLENRETAAALLLVVVTGVGGIGKSSLALRWLDQVRARFPAGQLFGDLGAFSPNGPASPEDVLGRFLRSLGIPPERVPLDLQERAALFRSLTAGRAIAMLLDDAASSAQVRAMLPGTGPSLVVVTTRRRIAGLAIDGAHFVELAPLEEDAAVELLGRIAGFDRTGADPQGARCLVGLCGRLPIAVCASGARLAPRPRWAIRRIVEELADERRRLAALSRTEDISVRAAFDVSYQALPTPAARLYRLLGLLPGSDFGEGVAAALADVDLDEADDLLNELVEASLLEEIAERRFRFHDLVRVHARDRAETEPPGERRAAVARSVDWYLRAAVAADLVVLPARWRLGIYYQHPPEPPLPLNGPAEAIEWLEAELDNLLAALRYAADNTMYEAGWQLCEALWGLFLFRKHYDAWLESHRIGLSCAQACADLRAQARMHNQLGSAYRSLRSLDKAIDHFTQALRLERAAGHRLGEGSALDQLGVAVLRLGRYDEAIQFFTQSLLIHQEVDEPRGVALMNLNLGQALSESGRHSEAIDHLRRASRQAAAIPEPYHQARALMGLGQTYIQSGRPNDAADPLDQAVAILRDLGASYDRARVHTRLATVAEQLGNIADTRTHLEQALALFTEVSAPQAADVRARLDALGPSPATPSTGSAGDGDT
jgi:tetratricopeptide (TPR) repeat protein